MFHEIRTYTLHPGKVAEYLKLAAEVSMPVRRNDCGVLLGWWVAEFGTLNRLVHIWSFKDLNERQSQRAALNAKPEWTQGYVPRVNPLVRRRHVSIVVPALPIAPPATPGNIYELRTYRTHVGKAPEWIGMFKKALPVREKYSRIVGLWQSEIGEQNEVQLLWAYRDLKERTEVRARTQQDPEWQAFVASAHALLVSQKSIILLPAPFSPLS
jgi:hypothetical protein